MIPLVFYVSEKVGCMGRDTYFQGSLGIHVFVGVEFATPTVDLDFV